MVQVVKVKSGSPYEEKESYSRIVAVDNWIFVSNTAGRNYKTREMSADPVEQAKQSLSNIEGALKSVGAGLADVITSTVYIPNPEDAPSVMAYVGERLKGIDPARTVLCSPLGNTDFKVEIEVTAYKGAGASETKYLNISL
ncbi:RidA family protein [Rhizobium rhizogenes]|jgi:enamine deaminase RidA (YjgF/YER057c/UK114 family)|uniref:RidA family protein n=1 Tax=Rhizobium rhizogenes TaxID=359 RepID=UPI00157385C5|nr:RidA family protein [Rhizobium rhizogenes]NTF47088.1 RidA family protein [Rhizobium rhizogenes]